MIDIREIAKELAKQPHREEVLAEVLRRVALSAFDAGYCQAMYQEHNVYREEGDPDPEPDPDEVIKS